MMLQQLLLTQMVARVLKNIIRQHLRSLDRGDVVLDDVSPPPSSLAGAIPAVVIEPSSSPDEDAQEEQTSGSGAAHTHAATKATTTKPAANAKGTTNVSKIKCLDPALTGYVDRDELQRRSRSCVLQWLNWALGTPKGQAPQYMGQATARSSSSSSSTSRIRTAADVDVVGDGRDAFLKTHMQVKFGLHRMAFSEEELKADNPIMSKVDRLSLLSFLVYKLGIQLAPSVIPRLHANRNTWFIVPEPFTFDDIVGVTALTRPTQAEAAHDDTLVSAFFASYLAHSSKFDYSAAAPSFVTRTNNGYVPASYALLPSANCPSAAPTATSPPPNPYYAQLLSSSSSSYSPEASSPSQLQGLSPIIPRAVEVTSTSPVPYCSVTTPLPSPHSNLAHGNPSSVALEAAAYHTHVCKELEQALVILPRDIVDTLCKPGPASMTAASATALLHSQLQNPTASLSPPPTSGAGPARRVSRLALLVEAEVVLDRLERLTKQHPEVWGGGSDDSAGAGGVGCTSTAIALRVCALSGIDQLTRDEAGVGAGPTCTTSTSSSSSSSPSSLELICEILSLENYVTALVQTALLAPNNSPPPPPQLPRKTIATYKSLNLSTSPLPSPSPSSSSSSSPQSAACAAVMVPGELLVRAHWCMARVAMNRGHLVLAVELLRSTLSHQEHLFGSDQGCSWADTTSLGQWTWGLPDPPSSSSSSSSSGRSSTVSYGSHSYTHSLRAVIASTRVSNNNCLGHPSEYWTIELLIKALHRMNLAPLANPLVARAATLWRKVPFPVTYMSGQAKLPNGSSQPLFKYIPSGHSSASAGIRARRQFSRLLNGSSAAVEQDAATFTLFSQIREHVTAPHGIYQMLPAGSSQDIFFEYVHAPVPPAAGPIIERAIASQQLLFLRKMWLYADPTGIDLVADMALLQAVKPDYTPISLQTYLRKKKGKKEVERNLADSSSSSSSSTSVLAVASVGGAVSADRDVAADVAALESEMWATSTLPGDVDCLCKIRRASRTLLSSSSSSSSLPSSCSSSSSPGTACLACTCDVDDAGEAGKVSDVDDGDDDGNVQSQFGSLWVCICLFRNFMHDVAIHSVINNLRNFSTSFQTCLFHSCALSLLCPITPVPSHSLSPTVMGHCARALSTPS